MAVVNTGTLPGGKANVVNAPAVPPAVPLGDTPKQDAPAKKAEPSIRTLKTKIRTLEKELAAKDLEIQEAVDKALIFQAEARNMKDTLEAMNLQNTNTLIAIRGSVVNSVNIIDVMGGQ